jgi:hypothetical protein
MANWRDDFYAALRVRDEREQANGSLYDACTDAIPFNCWLGNNNGQQMLDSRTAQLPWLLLRPTAGSTLNRQRMRPPLRRPFHLGK